MNKRKKSFNQKMRSLSDHYLELALSWARKRDRLERESPVDKPELEKAKIKWHYYLGLSSLVFKESRPPTGDDKKHVLNQAKKTVNAWDNIEGFYEQDKEVNTK